MNSQKLLTAEQKANKKLTKRFPFLLPRNRWGGDIAEDYAYDYTELDAMPEGWRGSFGIEMCERLSACLKKAHYSNKYRITQIKEKWGGLRWYDGGAPKKISEEIEQIISEYEHKSFSICIYCGKPAKYVTDGYVLYLCEDCIKDVNGRFTELPEKDK